MTTANNPQTDQTKDDEPKDLRTQKQTSEPGRGVDVEKQPFDVNGPSTSSPDETAEADANDSSEPGRGVDVEKQPFNVNDPSPTKKDS